MVLIDRLKFYIGFMVINYGKFQAMREVKKTAKSSFDELKDHQNKKLCDIVKYSYDYVPYYKNLFDKEGIKPEDIKTIKDLSKLPILTKADIIKNRDSLISKDVDVIYSEGSTGGSTGVPLKYRVSHKSSNIGFALLLRGWEYAGYKPGDKVAIVAGGSLVGKSIPFKQRVVDYILNFKRYSSYGIDEQMLKIYVKDMERFKPSFIRGYASSIFLLAQYVHDNQLEKSFNLKGIITTSEMLFKNQREFISKVFDTEVFDTYGLNDGAISAFECEKHDGMHIDMERGVLEVVDEQDNLVYEKEGRILATTLIEHAMPLLRYDTGDLGILTDNKCPCNSQRPLLKQLKGRVTDTLKLNGKYIGSPVITVLMGKTDVLQYQFIQLSSNKLLIKLLKGNNKPEDKKFIKSSVISHVGQIDIEFEYVDDFSTKKGNKHKFILNMDVV